MKKIIPIFLSVVLLLTLTACGSTGTAEESNSAITEKQQIDVVNEGGSSSEQAETPDASEPDQEASSETQADTSEPGKDILVVYFSATGTTKGVAEKIEASSVCVGE